MKLLSISEASAATLLTISTLRKWTRTNRIPFVRLGRRVLFREDELAKFIESRTVRPKQEP